MPKNLTRKEFDELCLFYKPIYVTDEYKGSRHWIVWTFKETKKEYHELQKKGGLTGKCI